MKVFISWSGNKSRQLGEVIRDWLPRVIQMVNPYFTPSDIEKGTRWSTDVASELENSEIGILCITADNIHSDWLLFEAGALSKSIDEARVCPILFGVTNTDLSGPLKQFQTSEFKKEEILKLIKVINDRLDENKIPPKTLEIVFNKWWPDLQSDVENILSKEEHSNVPIRSDRELIEEILQLSRSVAKNTSTPRIPSPAIKDLLRHYIDLHDDQASQTGDYQHTLDKMKKMHKPVDYMAKKYLGMSDELDTLISRVNVLSYKVTLTGSSDDQDDDDIPF